MIKRRFIVREIILILIALLMFSSCDGYFNIRPIEDSRFNGTFYHSERKEGWFDDDGYSRHTWIFDGTNKATEISQFWYWTGRDWLISGKRKGDKIKLDMEIEIKDGKYFRSRLWNSNKSEWSDWELYEFLPDGSLRFTDLEFDFIVDDYQKIK